MSPTSYSGSRLFSKQQGHTAFSSASGAASLGGPPRRVAGTPGQRRQPRARAPPAHRSLPLGALMASEFHYEGSEFPGVQGPCPTNKNWEKHRQPGNREPMKTFNWREAGKTLSNLFYEYRVHGKVLWGVFWSGGISAHQMLNWQYYKKGWRAVYREFLFRNTHAY